MMRSRPFFAPFFAPLVVLWLTSLGGPATAYADDSAPLGRLFFTPERRQALDRQRLSSIQETRSLEGETLSLDGVVQRSSGKATVWINGQVQEVDDHAHTGVSVRLTPHNPGVAQIVPDEETPTRLKVGEEINRATGERNDRLGGGLVKTPNRRR
jgi:antitoxin (DNA-binding transcriptional repressor) of toxin-antitoxin stability system